MGVAKSAGKRSGNTRRRFDVALNTQGAEMRLPSLPQVRVGWRVVSVALAAFLAVVLYQLWTLPIYQVDAAEVVGLKRLTSSHINSALNLEGQRIFTLDPLSLEQELIDSFAEFSSVSVEIGLPQTVMISVTERIPVLIWRQEGRSNLVDADGMTFPLRENSAVGNYPVVEAAGNPQILTVDEPSESAQESSLTDALLGKLSFGVSMPSKAKPLLTPEMASAILVMARQIPDGATMIYHTDHGLGWKDRRGFEVFVGDAQNMEMKMVVYKAILQQLKASETRPAMISVEFVHAPYYQVEQ
jgi:cell division protein FtsQ